jgi:hypothetical protein
MGLLKADIDDINGKLRAAEDEYKQAEYDKNQAEERAV